MATPGEVGQASESRAILWQTTDVARVESIEEFPKVANSENGWVYIIGCGTINAIKIGWSSAPERRIADISGGFPFEIGMLTGFPGTRGDELHMHRKFADLRLNGEWFNNDDEGRLMLFVIELQEKHGYEPWLGERNKFPKLRRKTVRSRLIEDLRETVGAPLP